MYIINIVCLTDLSALAILKVTFRLGSSGRICNPFNSVGFDVFFIFTKVWSGYFRAFYMTNFDQVVVFISSLVLWFIRIVWVLALRLFFGADIIVLLIMEFFAFTLLQSRRSFNVLDIHTISKVLFRVVGRTCTINVCEVHALIEVL